ncbi:c-type cytochrome [Winogradskyella endarachnes]|uniref:C-type cytochrome n=1 Tax=Winogradskyella endarachnes TaxID=2681965 RepID=A0A6L6U5X3_9FLAO|nr:cytochrome c [Winogradskyella endarachnes]MUU77600.1 c-type cytochrome [Winogradskyella endarachnes]
MKNQFFAICFLAINLACNSNSKTSNTLTKNQEPQPLEDSIKRGQPIYKNQCSVCHTPSGKGIPNVFPPLAESDYLIKKQTESIKAIKHGLSGKIIVNGVTYNGSMPSFSLSNQEIADVMNYINNSWGNKNSDVVTVDKVSEL